MKYRMLAPVVGRLMLRPGTLYRATRDDLALELHADSVGMVENVSVTAQVAASLIHKFTSQAVKGPDGRVKEFRIDGDVSLWKRLQNELQMFESTFAFQLDDHGLHRVRWDLWTEEFIPENETEKASLVVFRYGSPRKQAPETFGDSQRQIGKPKSKTIQ
jgi:hypothetical protein